MGAIAGGIVGGVLGAVLIAAAIFFCVRRQRSADHLNGEKMDFAYVPMSRPH